MTSGRARIADVSDTALITAAVRALETDRPDGLVRDPFAARLAGERGLTITQALPALELICFVVGLRTRIVDDLLMEAIRRFGIASVLSIGAGLDTRPWRLPLPAHLRWQEADLPSVLDYKAAALTCEQPACRIEHFAADITDRRQRRALFRAVPGGSAALMVSEGLLMYLPAATVLTLAEEAFTAGGIRYWISELATRGIGKAVATNALSAIAAVRAPDSLDGEDIARVLNRSGWIVQESRGFGSQALALAPPARLQALAGLLAVSAGSRVSAPGPAGDLSGVHLFAHE